MKKKVLLVTSVPSMIGQFNMDNIYILKELGYKVEVACDFLDCSIWTKESTGLLIEKLDEIDVKRYQIDFSRSPLDIAKHHKSYMQIKKLLAKGEYAFIHTHAPVSSAITRLACKNIDTKVIYTAHGFHFYTGAPIINWLLYYPIEKWLSKYTDILITINEEDYKRAKKNFNAKNIEYVPGIGVDVEKFKLFEFNREVYRVVLGLKYDEIMLISVGELNSNKNHAIIIKALAKISNASVHYYIAGIGKQKNDLIKLSEKLGLAQNVHFLDFRNDIAELLHSADIYIHPSLREGLPVALIEAMACSLPVLCSNIRGNNDLINEQGGVLFNVQKCDDLNELLLGLISNEKIKSMGSYNAQIVEKFSMKNICNKMEYIYTNVY